MASDTETEVPDRESGRLDMLQKGDDGDERFIIEAKAGAPRGPLRVRLPARKSIGLKVLQDLASPCGIDTLAAAVDAVAEGVDGRASPIDRTP